MFGMNKDLTKHFGERVGNEVPAGGGEEEEESGASDDDAGSSDRKRKAASAKEKKAKPAKKSKVGCGVRSCMGLV